MPSLDDIPTLPPSTPTADDLIAVIDGSDRRSPKQCSLGQLVALVPTPEVAPVIIPATPTTGFTITATPYVDQTHYLTPEGLLASGTFNLPTAANSRLGQIVRLVSTRAVTSITIGNGSVVEPSTPFGLVANTTYSYQCVATTGAGTWIRF